MSANSTTLALKWSSRQDSHLREPAWKASAWLLGYCCFQIAPITRLAPVDGDLVDRMPHSRRSMRSHVDLQEQLYAVLFKTIVVFNFARPNAAHVSIDALG